MEFRIADTFQESLANLTNQEQKAVKTTAFDLQIDPSRPGLKFHRIDRSRDKHFWSVRVNRDLRIVVHKTNKSLLLCYVDHHDDAYGWAERRKIERHPKTGAAQIVEVREKTIEVPVYVAPEEALATESASPILGDVDEEELLSYGVPEEWLDDVRGATEDTILDVVDHLPAEAAEAVLDLAVGETPQPVAAKAADDPFEHPDAQRRFRTIEDRNELERALEFPWDKWSVFLHPSQRSIVTGEYGGPARVAGSAGTGKTVVALHRAVHLLEENPDARVLLTTISDPLARLLDDKLRTLISNRPRLAERIDVRALDATARRLHRVAMGKDTELASPDDIDGIIQEVAESDVDQDVSQQFLLAEWKQVIDPWQLNAWEAYRDVPRVGRGTRLPKSRRETLWELFEEVRALLGNKGLATHASMYDALTAYYADNSSPYDFIVVDEAQDLSVAQLRFLSALTGHRTDGLFFAGDLGQRIFQPPFSWKRLGVDVRGRSFTLRINYRTSHQIRRHADRLLDPEIADVDGITEDRRGTRSVFNGPDPQVKLSDDSESEAQEVASWLSGLQDEGLEPNEIGVFVRSEQELSRARKAVETSGMPYQVLDENSLPKEDHLSLSTMHLAKGLEFRAVAVMACDDTVLPLQNRLENVGDMADLKEVYDTERHLLYVACTRARDHLLITGEKPGSEFLEDMLA